MRIVLVHMPWGAIDMPSLALGILYAAATRGGHETRVRYANLDFVDWAAGEAGLGRAEYTFFAQKSYFEGAGDWVFSGALYDDDAPDDGRYFRFLAQNGVAAEEMALIRAMRAIAPRFVERLVADIAAAEPDVVGFTTTFQQNTASLAAARLLKRALPRVRTVFGGANCDGPQGAALHRNFPFVDYVVRGEGEAAFPALLDAIAGGEDPAALDAIPGLCRRLPSGESAANPLSPRPLPPGAILTPVYDGYFDRLDASVAAAWVDPKLVVEGSRGCWWGEKHHCTFCGLNGSSMLFRSKPPDEFLAELLELAARHQLLDFYVVDNILDMGYFDTVLRALAESDLDLRLHFEVKSNLRRHQFQLLADAGAVQVQPGIESLSTRVLRIMDKGVTGCQNVRALRDAQSAGVSVDWNYLYGFPGETAADYTPIVGQLPALHHLDPPVSTSRISIERFSPYFDRPELGFDIRRPAPHYRDVYRLPEAELIDLAYVFATTPRGIDATAAGALAEAVEDWCVRYPASRLSYDDQGDRIVLVNTRAAFDWHVLELTGPAELALFRLLEQPRTAAGLAGRIAGGEAAVAPLIARWTALGLLFHENGSLIHVAAESRNQVLMRMQYRHGPAAAAAGTREVERVAVG